MRVPPTTREEYLRGERIFAVCAVIFLDLLAVGVLMIVLGFCFKPVVP